MMNLNPLELVMQYITDKNKIPLSIHLREGFNSLADAMWFATMHFGANAKAFEALHKIGVITPTSPIPAPHLVSAFRTASDLAWSGATGARAAHRDGIDFDPENISASLEKIIPAGQLINFLVSDLKQADRLVDPQADNLEARAIESLKKTYIRNACGTFVETSCKTTPNLYIPTSETLIAITGEQYWRQYAEKLPPHSQKILGDIASSLEPTPIVS